MRWVEAPAGPKQASPETRTIARLANALAYSLTFEDGDVSLEWQAGTVGDLGDILPIRDCLTGRCPPELAEKIAPHIARLKTGNPSQAWLAYRFDDGSERWLHDNARVEFDAGGVMSRIRGVVRDVTAERGSLTAQDALWRRLTIENVDLALACWDADQRLALFNDQFGQLFSVMGIKCARSMPLDAFLDRVARSREVVLGGTAEDWVARTLADHRRNRSTEWLLADGRSIDVTWRDMNGGTLLRLQDTTVARNGERALRQAKQIAEEANAKKSRFLRAANHDLRQPLATLKILIFSGFESCTEEDLRELLRSMDVAVSVMDEILGSLLQVGQLDANRIVVQKHHFQASQMLDRLRTEFTPLAKAKNLDLRVINSFVTLESDRILLERILGNFIANAIRFTEKGGILVGLRRRGAQVEIQVWDTGCGIAEDQLELIFEEFHQIDPKSSGRQRGLGLGLNIAQRVAELMDHELRVTSRLGHGSMFSVRVPVGNIWQSRVGESEISERLAGEFLGVCVMVIEDDENLRAAVEGMLGRWGVKVLAVRDGGEALEALKDGAFRPDLILVDYSLPNGMAGTEALAQIRQSLGRDVPGIVCTADTETGLLNRIRASGVPLLIKPISPPRLRSVMHHLIYEKPDREPASQRDAAHE